MQYIPEDQVYEAVDPNDEEAKLFPGYLGVKDYEFYGKPK